MRHLLMDPAFPDMIGEWAADETQHEGANCANDNGNDEGSELSDPLLLAFARLDIDATRIW